LQRRFLELINGYVDTPNIEEYIVTPKLADNAGTIGCLTLAKDYFLFQMFLLHDTTTKNYNIW
jgi:hypothetical protein